MNLSKRIAIFASGEGTNAENIIRHFQHHEVIQVAVVISDRKDANGLIRAEKLNVPAKYFSKEDFENTNVVLDFLEKENIDLMVLAGFLKLMPEKIIKEYQGRIINIHPALLPKFGGKGMYGMKVHEAVIAAGEKETGITIHHVNKNFDEGEIIFQKKIPVQKNETADTLFQKVRNLELEFYPKVIEKILIQKT